MRDYRSILFFAVATTLFLPGRVPSNAPSPQASEVEVQREVDALVKKLASADVKERQQAAARLIELGPTALPALEGHLMDAPGVRERIIGTGRAIDALAGGGSTRFPRVEVPLGEFRGPGQTNQFGGLDQLVLNLTVVLSPFVTDPEAAKTELEAMRAKLRHVVIVDFMVNRHSSSLDTTEKVQALCTAMRASMNRLLRPAGSPDMIAEVLIHDMKR